jgi:hypothetical protein
MADNGHGVAPPSRGGPDELGARAGREPLVDLDGETERLRDRRRRLARAEERARQDGVEADALAREARAERARLLTAGRRERAQLVGFPGRGFRMANHVDAQVRRRSG